MGFYIRKSIKFGPIRLNISKSGIGISSGVPGARISTGPHGTYVNIGKNGVYYRKKIDETISASSSQQSHFEKTATPDSEIPTTNINELIESSNSELITQINSRIQQPTYALLIGLASVIVAGGFVFSASIIPSNLIIIQFLLLLIAFIVGVTSLYLAWGTNQQEKLARTTTLKYNLDEETNNKFIEVQNAFLNLAKSIRIWRVLTEKTNWDWKRNAGASSLITRRIIRVGLLNPQFLQTQTKVYGFSLGSMDLFFLPDQVFIFQNGKYGAVPYTSLKISTYSTRFIESDGVPSDSKIVDHTWQYVRKDGGPDRRFSNNRQIPIAQYGQIEVSSQSGMNLYFQVSNLSLAQQFAQILSHYIDYYKEPYSDSSSKTSAGSREEPSTSRPNKKPRISSAYSVLNVPSNASKEDITSAYKKLAQQYHPDKVAGLASEFSELAEKRMKEINAAYQELMSKFKE